jgi:hypothetical protein
MVYNWLIEIRTMREMYRLKKELKLKKVPRVPHISLVYDFTPKINPYKIAKVIQETAEKYKKLELSYKGLELKKGIKGYVLSFKIEPSDELQYFRYELYHNLEPYIYESSSAKVLNSASSKDFWFHASIAYHLKNKTAKRIKNFIETGNVEKSFISTFFSAIFGNKIQTRIKSFNLHARVIRITLLRSGRIVYEYDTLLNKILNRREALSRKTFEQDMIHLKKI